MRSTSKDSVCYGLKCCTVEQKSKNNISGRKRGGKGKQSNDGFGSVEANHLMPSLVIIALISGGWSPPYPKRKQEKVSSLMQSSLIIVVVFFWSYINPNWDEEPKTVLDHFPPYTIDPRGVAWNLRGSSPLLLWRPCAFLFPFSKGFPDVSLLGPIWDFLFESVE